MYLSVMENFQQKNRFAKTQKYFLSQSFVEHCDKLNKLIIVHLQPGFICRNFST